jgi:hypothetical protein
MIRMAQTPIHKYLPKLLQHIERQARPVLCIPHTARLEDGPDLYKTFNGRKDRLHQGRS